jgi:hypothetical protein
MKPGGYGAEGTGGRNRRKEPEEGTGGRNRRKEPEEGTGGRNRRKEPEEGTGGRKIGRLDRRCRCASEKDRGMLVRFS